MLAHIQDDVNTKLLLELSIKKERSFTGTAMETGKP